MRNCPTLAPEKRQEMQRRLEDGQRDRAARRAAPFDKFQGNGLNQDVRRAPNVVNPVPLQAVAHPASPPAKMPSPRKG